MRSLFAISDDLLALETVLLETGGEITDDEAGRELERYFEHLHEERDRKVNGICWLIKELEARAKVRYEAARQLHALSEIDDNAAERLRGRLKLFMQQQGLKRLETDHARLTLAQNGGKAPLVIPEAWEQEPAQAPEAYQRRVIHLDKEAIREDLEDGILIPGCAIGERGTHLRLK